VALKVYDVETGEVAEPRAVVRHDRAEPGRIGRDTGEVVVARGRVNSDARLPVAEVLGSELVEVLDGDES
jgi:hypothetical protein